MNQTGKRLGAVAAALALMAPAAACSTSSSSKSGGDTITVGLLTDLTGPAASSAKTSVQGVQPGLDALALPAGLHIRIVQADSATNPTTITTAAHQLVQQDHVSAVIAVSALFFAAAPYLTQAGVPVVGVAEDGPEWITSKNMFSVYGAIDTTKVSDGAGRFFKQFGASTIGSIGYSISPSSAEAAKAVALSSQHAGLKVGYLNANFPFGSTNVAPEAIAMKNAHVDGFTASVDPNTGFALISALRQLGDTPKVALLPTGYGGDLVQAGPNAVREAQGVYFGLQYEPMEMNTPATQKFQAGLRQAGVAGDPTYGEYCGYASVALLVEALQAAGPHPSTASLMTALQGVTHFDAAGLLGSNSFTPNDRASTAIGTGCSFYTRLTGSTFALVPGADPFCGQLIPGASVSASS